MSLRHRLPKENPHKPKRNYKNFAKFMGAALVLLFLVEFVFFKGDSAYISKIKQDYYANQAMQNKALEDALPPKIVFPNDGSEYFEAPELILKEEQSLLPERQLNITKFNPLDEKPKLLITPNKPKTEKFVYKLPKGQKPKIAIVIDDVGMNIKQSHAAINLPKEVTLAMLPYAKTVRDLAKQAKSKGHELIIHTPMEAMKHDVSLGSMGLYKNMDATSFKKEFDKMTKSFEGYDGINNHMGSLLTQDPAAMKILMSELKKRGLFFLDSKTIGASVAADIAQSNGVPNASRDVFLDHVETPEFVQKALLNTERIARENGYAIAIGHPKQFTMAALQKWLPTLEAKGYELVPLSALIHNPNKKLKSAKTEESASESKDVVKIEPASGSNEDEQKTTFNLEVPVKNTPAKTIQMERAGLPKISYPVN